jgi:hypothetical protein
MASYTIQASGIVRQLNGAALGGVGYPTVSLHEWTATGPQSALANVTVTSNAQGHWSVSTTGGDTTKTYVVKLVNSEDANQVRYVPVAESQSFYRVVVGSGGETNLGGLALGYPTSAEPGQIWQIVASVASIPTRITLEGENSDSFRISARGTLTWGIGTGAGDTNLYRSAGNTLKTDDSFIAANLSAVGVATVGGLVVSTAATLAATWVDSLATVISTNAGASYITGGLVFSSTAYVSNLSHAVTGSAGTLDTYLTITVDGRTYRIPTHAN